VLALLAAALAAGVPDLGVVALFPSLVLVLAANAGGPAWLFANPAAHRLGIWSYAVYLLHPLLQAPQAAARDVLANHLPLYLAATCAMTAIIALLLGLACAAYHLIEVPGRRAVRVAWSHARPRYPDRSTLARN
jgi:peptidoglycan/LPS O-acetylase OafA/YrhL